MTNSTTQQKADAYDGLSAPFHHMAKELKALGMKKPAETLSANKVKFINRILADIQEITKLEPAARYLDLLDEEALPQYSDAILILSQYEGALSAFHGRYFGYLGHDLGHGWRTKRN
jgi:hypothetical protein